MRNVLVAGSVGAGKTNLAKLLVRRATQLGSVLILDVKHEYGDVIAWAREAGLLAEELSVGEKPLLKVNPLEPPLNVVPEVWVGCVADIITRCYGLSEPSRRILQDCILQVYEGHGLLDLEGYPLTWPTLRELEQEVARFPAEGVNEASSKRALESRLHLMTMGTLGKSLNTMVGFDPGFFTGKVVAVGLDGVASLRDQRVVGELVVGALWEFRRANPPVQQILHTIVFEEAHRFVPEARSSWEQGTRTLLERCFAEGRSYGLGLVAVDQQPSLLSRYVLANTGTKFAGRLASHEDVQLVVDNFVMQEEPLPEFRFRKLLPGQMYAQLTYAPSSTMEWGPGYQLFQIPQITKLNSSQEGLGVTGTAWFQQKLKNAILTTYHALQEQNPRLSISELSSAEIERMLHRYINESNRGGY